MPVFTFTNATLTLKTRRTSTFRCAIRRISYRDGDALRFRKRGFKRRRRHSRADAAMPGVYVDARQIEDGRFDINLHPLFRAERRSSPDMIAGMAVGDLGRAGRDRLDASRTSEIFNRNFLIAVHQADKRLFRLVFENYRLNRRVMIYPQFSRALRCSSVRRVIVGEQFKIDLRGLKRANRHRHRYCLRFHTLPPFFNVPQNLNHAIR